MIDEVYYEFTTAIDEDGCSGGAAHVDLRRVRVDHEAGGSDSIVPTTLCIRLISRCDVFELLNIHQTLPLTLLIFLICLLILAQIFKMQ